MAKLIGMEGGTKRRLKAEIAKPDATAAASPDRVALSAAIVHTRPSRYAWRQASCRGFRLELG